MPEFGSIREAKDYLAGKIAAQAEREGNPLSDLERKMLYFSETGWTLPDMAEVSAEFDRTCDQDAYEQKIAALVRNIRAARNTGSEAGRREWDRAIKRLNKEDHYLLILVGADGAVGDGSAPAQEAWLRPWLIALGLALGAIALVTVLQAIFATH